MQGIGAALQVLRKRERQRRGPPRVIDIVMMEMDCAVMLRLLLPVMRLAGPVPSFHRPGREVDQRAMMLRGAGVDRARRRYLA